MLLQKSDDDLPYWGIPEFCTKTGEEVVPPPLLFVFLETPSSLFGWKLSANSISFVNDTVIALLPSDFLIGFVHISIRLGAEGATHALPKVSYHLPYHLYFLLLCLHSTFSGFSVTSLKRLQWLCRPALSLADLHCKIISYIVHLATL